jgi:hypothetical protein
MRALTSVMTDRSPDHRAEMPCAAGIEALRELLRYHVRNDGAATPEESWRIAARLMCEDARTRAVQVEELLIAIKRTWPAVAESAAVPRVESPRLLARFVTICVEEYYSPLD